MAMTTFELEQKFQELVMRLRLHKEAQLGLLPTSMSPPRPLRSTTGRYGSAWLKSAQKRLKYAKGLDLWCIWDTMQNGVYV
jgi:hypothetical protein